MGFQGLGWEEWTTKVNEGTYGVIQLFCTLILVVISQLYACITTQNCAHKKNLAICKLY